MRAMITLYGIKNCDTVKRARTSLEQAGIAFNFHDFRADGLTPALAQQWLDALGADVLINRRGTTWRGLDASTQAALFGAEAAQILPQHTSVIKRPVLNRNGALRVGFAKAEEADILHWLKD